MTLLSTRGRAVVTGGSGGIGLAAARGLRADGWEVVLVARNADKLKAAAEALDCEWYSLDCTNEAAARRVAEDIGAVDLVVHTAGVLQAGRVRRQSLEKFARVIDGNLITAYVVGSSFLPQVSPGGRFVFVASTAAVDSVPYMSAYAAAKAGVRAMAASFREECVPEGISVHVLMPGTVDTEMMSVTEKPRAALLPDDVTSAVVWLAALSGRVRVDELVLRPVEGSPFTHTVKPSDHP